VEEADEVADTTRDDAESELSGGVFDEEDRRCSEMASIHSLFAAAVGAQTTIVAGRPLCSLMIWIRSTHNREENAHADATLSLAHS
jgi:hypothetical protein